MRLIAETIREALQFSRNINESFLYAIKFACFFFVEKAYHQNILSWSNNVRSNQMSENLRKITALPPLWGFLYFSFNLYHFPLFAMVPARGAKKNHPSSKYGQMALRIIWWIIQCIPLLWIITYNIYSISSTVIRPTLVTLLVCIVLFCV